MGSARHVVEKDIDKHYQEAVSAAGGVTRLIQYRGRKGAADHLTGFPFNRLYLVELKRPSNSIRGSMGGRIEAHQQEDEKHWRQVGVEKVYLWTFEMVNDWIAKVRV